MHGVLVGIQEFSTIARNSIGSKQDTMEVVEITRMYEKIKKIGDGVWETFSEGGFDLEIKKAMRGEVIFQEDAIKIAKILKEAQEEGD